MFKDVAKHRYKLDSYQIKTYLCSAIGKKRVPTFRCVGILFIFIVKKIIKS